MFGDIGGGSEFKVGGAEPLVFYESGGAQYRPPFPLPMGIAIFYQRFHFVFKLFRLYYTFSMSSPGACMQLAIMSVCKEDVLSMN